MGRRRRSLRAAVPLLALALVAGGCSALTDEEADADAPPESALPAAATLLRVATAEWPACLNPITCADDVARSLVLQHVVPQLMELDPSGGYVPGPVLATSPEVRVDRETGEQTIVFVLAEEARWHDGRPITSSDVRGTWLARTSTPGASTPGHDLITAVDDADPLVARVTLRQPWADWPELFGGHTGWLLQADAFGDDTDLTGRFDDFVTFGAGPYELVSFDEQSLVLVARAGHWDEDRQGAIDQIRIDHFPDLGAADAAVPGSIDLVIPGEQAPEVPDRFEVRRRPAAEVVGLLFDRRTPALGSLGVRTAIEQAIDRRELAERAGADADDLVTCIGWLPGDDACGDQLVEEGASIEATDAILAFDGWQVGADGVRGRPGLPLATPVSYDPALPGARAVANAVVEALVGRGFVAAARAVPEDEWLRPDRQSGLGIGVYATPLGTAGRVRALHACADGAVNPLAWCEPEPQVLSAALTGAVDERTRNDLAGELGDLAASAFAWLPLHQRATHWLVDPDRIRIPDEAPLGSGPLGALHDLERADR